MSHLPFTSVQNKIFQQLNGQSNMEHILSLTYAWIPAKLMAFHQPQLFRVEGVLARGDAIDCI